MSGTPPAPRYFLLRVRRDGPLVPARIWLCDGEPGNEDNKLDRGRLSVYPRAEIAGEEVDPEHLFDRTMSPIDWNPGYAPSHWKFAQAISEAEYRYQVARIKWARRHRPGDPTTQPRQPIDPAQLPLPNFDTENGRA